jgi:glycosyltransferase involved in cell wall biosynthesis
VLKGHSIIYLGVDNWDGLWRNRQQFMSMLATQNKVLFVEGRPFGPRRILSGLHRGELGLSDLRRPSLQRISENLHTFRYPIWAPISSARFPFNQLTGIVRRLFLRWVLQKLQISEPIVWVHHPRMIDLVNDIPSPRLLLYHVVDEYTAYPCVTPARRRRIEEREKEMMAFVDAVIVVSKKLYEAKRPFNPNTYLVPNGVNYEAYTAALADPYLPDDLRVIKTPRLGYSGLIGDRLNLTVLKELAQQNPQWSLVLLGEVDVSQQIETWRAMRALPNVHYLGLVGISQVPHYVKGFQVGLIPYLQNRETEHVSPIKLYDYLAAGLPVASVDIPAVREFSQHIHLANGPHGFSQAVRTALADTAPERRQARREVAAQNSWEARVEQLSDLIQAQLVAKTPR